MTGRVLVAGVGNVLRGDDGFGVAVAQRLEQEGRLPPNVDLIETGIGGMSLVQKLMDGYAGLIVVDAVEQGAAPGTLFVIAPEVLDGHAMPVREWQAVFSNMHLAEPSRVFALARAIGALPERLLVVGCQPQDTEEMSETLSPPVAAAVGRAAAKVRELAASMLEATPCA